FGFADAAAMALARSQGAPVKMLSVIHAKFPISIIHRRNSGISTPYDLEGKHGVSGGSGSPYILFPAFVRMLGLDESAIRFDPVDPAVMSPGLLTGRFDYIAAL